MRTRAQEAKAMRKIAPTLAVLITLALPAMADARTHHHKHHHHAHRAEATASYPTPNFGPQSPEEESIWRREMSEEGFSPQEILELE